MFKRMFKGLNKTEKHINGLEFIVENLRERNKKQEEYIDRLEKTLKIITVVHGISEVKIEHALLIDPKLSERLQLEMHENPSSFSKTIRWK